MVEIFGHRGASGYVPENTLEAFDLAMKQGADGVELDVQLTKDGEVVVVHDERIDRVSNGHGYVRDYTLRELKEYSFHNHMMEYQNIRIPTLKEVLELLKPSGMKVNIEIKTGIYWYPEIEQKTLEIVKSAQMEERIIYSSFNHYSIQKIQQLDSQAETAFLFSDVILDMEKYTDHRGVKGIHPAVYHLKMSNFLDKFQENGKRIRVWTVNEENDIREFVEKGVTAIITNYPDRAIKIRSEVE